MKSIVSAFFVSAMLLGSVSGASAASWIQASSTEEQLSTDAKPKAVVMNSTDGAKNIKMDKGVITNYQSCTPSTLTLGTACPLRPCLN